MNIFLEEGGTMKTKPASLQDKFRGTMLGTAAGDCLGRPVEGHRPVSDFYLSEVLTSHAFLSYSDDTAMTRVLARSLLDRDGFSGAHMSLGFAREFRAEPFRGYGRNVVDVFHRVERGTPWDVAAARQFGGQGSYGNGAAMRVAPVALWAFPDREQVVRLAADTARVTHTHPVGVEGAVIQALAVSHALFSDATSPFDADTLLTDLDARIVTDKFRDKLEVLVTCLGPADDDRARLHLGNWVSAHNSVLTALYCFLASTDLTETIMRALRMGGDVDTIAAMAGAIGGARWGATALPPRWQRVEGGDALLDLADELFQRTANGANHQSGTEKSPGAARPQL